MYTQVQAGKGQRLSGCLTKCEVCKHPWAVCQNSGSSMHRPFKVEMAAYVFGPDRPAVLYGVVKY